MTHQEIFNKVVTHLFTQGRPARDEEGHCMYRGPNKTSCAVGCLIPDEKYKLCMEGKSAMSLATLYQDEVGELFLNTSATFLQSLQRAHDRCATNKDDSFDKDHLKSLLIEVASAHSLSTEVLESY